MDWSLPTIQICRRSPVTCWYADDIGSTSLQATAMPSDSEEENEDVDFDLDEDPEPDLEDEGLLDGIEVADDATEDGDDVRTHPPRIYVSHVTLGLWL